MGYSSSIKTLESRIHLVEPLISSLECQWSCKEGEERILAYQLREALHVAKTTGADKYPQLAVVADKISIKVVGAGLVRSQRKQELKLTEVSVTTLGNMLRPANSEQLVVEEPLEILQVIGLLSEDLDEAQFPIHFPNTDLSKEDLRTLLKWTNENTNYLVFWSGSSITVNLYDEDLADVALTEDDLED